MKNSVFPYIVFFFCASLVSIGRGNIRTWPTTATNITLKMKVAVAEIELNVRFFVFVSDFRGRRLKKVSSTSICKGVHFRNFKVFRDNKS